MRHTDGIVRWLQNMDGVTYLRNIVRADMKFCGETVVKIERPGEGLLRLKMEDGSTVDIRVDRTYPRKEG